NKLVQQLTPRYSSWLAANPTLEDVTRITQAVAAAATLALKANPVQRTVDQVAEILGANHKTFAGDVLDAVKKRRQALWEEHINQKINWELFDRGVETFTWAALEELARNAKGRGLLSGATHGDLCAQFA